MKRTVKTSIKGNIFIAGCGAVAQCVLPLLFKNFSFKPRQIKIVDPLDKRKEIKEYIDQGILFEQVALGPKNYKSLLSGHLKRGDIFIDLANQIDTQEILEWCLTNKVIYLNTALNNWETAEGTTTYDLYKAIKKVSKKHDHKPTGIISHGANPGLISSFVKQGILDIGRHVIATKNSKSTKGRTKSTRTKESVALKPLSAARLKKVEHALKTNNFPELAQALGVRVIHITEHDAHHIDRTRKQNEFLNTWSVVEFVTESTLSARLAWGVHESLEHLNKKLAIPQVENGTATFEEKGMEITMRSWLPNEEYIGIIPPHDEVFSIADYLSIKDDESYSYRPSVAFIYNPCDVGKQSLEELARLNFKLQKTKKVVKQEISHGKETMGCLIMGDFGSWWTGSIVTLDEARSIIPDGNGTILQVAAGMIGALSYAVTNPKLGVMMPEQLDHSHILKIAKPYLGDFVSEPISWRPGKTLYCSDFLSPTSLLKKSKK